MASLCTTIYAKRAEDLAQINTQHLQDLLDAATDLIEGKCDRVFASADYAETLDGTGQRFIYVNNPPLNSFTSIVMTDSNDTTETILADQFRTKSDDSVGRITFKSSNSSSYSYFPEDNDNVTVNYNGGYDTIPSDVQRACLLVARNLHMRTSGGVRTAFKSERLGEHNFTREAVDEEIFTPDVMALLSKYIVCVVS